MRIKKIAERRTIWGGGRRRRKSAARWTRATARRRNGPRRSTTSLSDLRGRAAAPHGGPSRGSLIHNIDEGTALPASLSRAPPRPRSAVIRERLVTRAPAPRRRRASREGRRRRPSRPRGRRPNRARLETTARAPRSSGRRASKATSWACVSGAAQLFESTRLAQVLAVISFEWRDTAVYCHAVATSPAYRSRAGSSGSLQAGSRLVAFVRPRPVSATPFWACEAAFSPSFAASTRRASEFDVRVLGLCDAPRSPRPIPPG